MPEWDYGTVSHHSTRTCKVGSSPVEEIQHGSISNAHLDKWCYYRTRPIKLAMTVF